MIIFTLAVTDRDFLDGGSDKWHTQDSDDTAEADVSIFEEGSPKDYESNIQKDYDPYIQMSTDGAEKKESDSYARITQYGALTHDGRVYAKNKRDSRGMDSKSASQLNIRAPTFLIDPFIIIIGLETRL